MEIILCRHTQTDHNHNRIYSGHKDIELNEIGRKQSDALAHQISLLDGPSIGAILCSDLVRAAYLGMAIGKRIDIVPMFTPQLREVHMGGMQGYLKEEAMVLFPDRHHRTNNPDFDYRDVGGESAAQVIARQQEFLTAERARLEAKGVQRIVVVGHSISLRLLFRHTLGLIDQLHDQGEYQIVSW